jgi:CheY-like chemotaxis protein
VEVSDNGIGIDPVHQLRIFRALLSSPALRECRPGGLGLGLTICKRLIEMHKGTIECSSPGIGQGSTFVLRLPIHDAEEAAGAPGEEPVSRRILVVDDNRDAADSLCALLEIKGHQTHPAYSGSEAIQMVLAFRLNVVLLDIAMPELNGYDTARHIKAIDSAIRLIALSGYGQPDDRRQSTAAGFDFHITKPAGEMELEAALGR